MKNSRKFTAALAAISLVGVSACVTDPNTGERKVSRAAIGGTGGAVAGALLGGLIGGRTARIAGAVAGGALGGYVGYRMDQQFKELKDQTAGSGIDVTETDGGQAILVNLPDGVTFATGSYSINPAFQSSLDRVAASLQQYPNSLVDVYGYTDTVGSAQYNLGLSQRRANTVAAELVRLGVPRQAISTAGYGFSRPLVPTGPNVREPQNRRVEIILR